MRKEERVCKSMRARVNFPSVVKKIFDHLMPKPYQCPIKSIFSISSIKFSLENASNETPHISRKCHNHIMCSGMVCAKEQLYGAASYFQVMRNQREFALSVCMCVRARERECEMLELLALCINTFYAAQ